MRSTPRWLPILVALAGCASGTHTVTLADGAVTDPSQDDASANPDDATNMDGNVVHRDGSVPVSPDGFAFDDVSTTQPDVFVGPLPPLVNFSASDAPADAPDHFADTPSGTSAAVIAYPEAGTIIPRNLPSFEVHFTPAHGDDLWAVQFRGLSSAIRIYTRCTGDQRVGTACAIALTPEMLENVARAADDSNGEVRLSVLGVHSASATAATESPAQTLGIPPATIQGGMYYWTTAAASTSVLRYDFGLAGARSETFLTGTLIGCPGCHVLARNGTRATVGFGIPGLAMNTYDVATRAQLGGSYAGSFAAFSPDAQQVIVNSWSTLSLVDSTTGAALDTLPGHSTDGTMPDWSPDGRRVVFVRGQAGPTGVSGPSDLYFMSSIATGGFSSPVQILHSTGECNYYPSYSPDGRWVLFNRSADTSYAAPDARVFVMPTNGGPVTELAAANTMDRVSNSWPKWAPFIQTYQGEPLMWVTFGSVRPYGVRPRPSEGGGDAGADHPTAQLWMAAFRPQRVGTTEPSAPAFWMPFQDLGTGNRIAQWTETVHRHACVTDADCMSGEHCLAITSTRNCVAR